jgi:8-oxo-dGTP diphosphatase
MITCIFENDGKSSLRHVCVDVIVLNKHGQILLAKRTGKLLEGGKWGLIGGFVDRDETAAQGAEREIMEETGYHVKDLTLLRLNDNPNRPHEDRQNITFAYFCTATKKTGEHDWESDELKWFDIDELPPADQIAFDHLSNIELYKKYRHKPFPLPVVG